MKRTVILCFVLVAVVFCLVGVVIGVSISNAKKDATVSNSEDFGGISFIDTQTFFAEIVDINGAHFVVDGLDTNGINHSGKFQFSIDEDAILVWRGTNISLGDFKVGDIIAITYTGPVLEISPAIIENVLRLERAVEVQ